MNENQIDLNPGDFVVVSRDAYCYATWYEIELAEINGRPRVSDKGSIVKKSILMYLGKDLSNKRSLGDTSCFVFLTPDNNIGALFSEDFEKI